MNMKALSRLLSDTRNLPLVAIFIASFGLRAVPVEIPGNAEIVQSKIARAQADLGKIQADIDEARQALRYVDEELKGSFDSDSRLMLVDKDKLPVGYEKIESKYWLDGRPLEPAFDDFIAEGEHQLRVEKVVQSKNQVFRVANTLAFKAGKSKTLTIEAPVLENIQPINAPDDSLIIEFKSSEIPNNKSGRSLLAVQDLQAPVTMRLAQEPWLIVNVVNKMAPGFRIIAQELFLDGKPLPTLELSLATGEGEVVFEGALLEGSHQLEAKLTYLSKNRVPSYIKGYKYQMRFHRNFTVKKGAITRIELVGEKK